MTNIQGTNVAAPIVPFTTQDDYATHESNFGKGGWHEKATIAERDAIPEKRRQLGMSVYVLETKTLYVLENSLTNDGWIAKPFSGSADIEAHNADPEAHKELFEQVKMVWQSI